MGQDHHPSNPPPRLIYTAKVVSTKDPEGLHRVQVKLEGFSEEIELPWVRLVGPYASNQFGYVWLPEVDDEVLLLQGQGEALDQMVCIGAVYNGTNKPVQTDSDGKNNIKEIRTRTGHRVTFDDTDGTEVITIMTAKEEHHMVFDVSAGSITITGTKLFQVEIPDGDVVVNCTTATVTASDAVTVEGKSTVDVKSPAVTIKGDSTVDVKGGDITIDGGNVVIKGSSVAIN